ncbi:glycosyltransferase family 2 protein [Cohnella candidum]|uniref:Glycosyltransferase family 2 protein n=1 Tax=Cohnella candidum TaxID=2674991 RepID=A0A3G3K004_9BACL|nr:glycosyltransferase family 2 protein [Cohnella candidum]AYQ73845.1 glycosyltransferase family 2 protein [Cohnella candidum]
MKTEQGMTLAVCTRNRHEELERCIVSIAGEAPGFPCEVMVVDDGELPDPLRERLNEVLRGAGMAFTYHRKRRPGLLYSRIDAAEHAAHDILLFLDDDVELEEGYLRRLARLYSRYEGAAGFGGIDVFIRSNWKWDWFTRLILYDSGKPGKLSPGGFGGSMTRWTRMKDPFRTEFMLGCNMSFRRTALLGLPDAEWLSGYSLGEDLYLSHWAARSGPLWIDPSLRVKHYQSPVSRDKEEQVAFTEVVNHYRLLRLKRAGSWRHAAHLWTSIGLWGRAWARKKWRHKAPYYGKAIREVLVEDWRRLFRESVSDLGNG